MGKCATPIPSMTHGFSRGPTSKASPCEEWPSLPRIVVSVWKAASGATTRRPRKIGRSVNRVPLSMQYSSGGVLLTDESDVDHPRFRLIDSLVVIGGSRKTNRVDHVPQTRTNAGQPSR